MARPVFRDNRGMTLIEVLIAFVLVAITAAALMKTTLLAMNVNVINEMRDEAVNVAEQQMNDLRNTPFVSLSTGTEPPITRSIRGITCSYSPQVTVTDINDQSKEVSLTISWSYRSQQYQHTIATVLRQEQ
ncbi:MAG: prepilin-type N-terminal cleavage/methylation domain-containing protein [Nitrospiraceae bacterium]|nr:prepilin-type N-terminal cleavage/methylation domain-containing protein [Nitrospiraceae bacterium]